MTQPQGALVTCQQHAGQQWMEDDCVTPYASGRPDEQPPTELTWEDVWAAIGREVWKLAPQDFQDSGHRDLKFLTNWQDIMYAVDQGIASCHPDEARP